MEQNQLESVKSDLQAVLPRLYRYARNLTGNISDAEDLLQATCERALSRWQQFRPGSEFDRWAFTIMRSVHNNLLRSEAVRAGQGRVDAEPSLTAPESQSPEGNKIRQQVLDRVQALPDNQRQVMMLVYLEGFSYSAAAEILEIPIGTVMSRIGRARIRLAAELNTLDANMMSRVPTVENEEALSAGKPVECPGVPLSGSDESVTSRQQAGSPLQTIR